MAVAGLHTGLHGREGQSLSIHEVKKRVTGCDQDVDAYVKLKIVDEEVLGLCKATGKNNNTLVPQYLWGFESRNFLNPGVLNPPPWIPNSRDVPGPCIK